MENEQWARAKALEGLAVRDPRYGNPRDAEAVYKRLKQSAKTPGVRRTAELALLDDELADGQYAKVIAELQGVSRPSPDFPELYYELLLAQLLSGKKAEAAATAEESAEKADEADEEHRKDLLWVAAVGQLFTNTGNFEETSRKFLGTNHDYVPYIAMILATRMTENSQTSEDTQSVLKESIVNVDRSLWGARLREGDDSAWREMLIAYYLKQVSRDQIFGELDDEQRYNRSDLRFVLWREGQLCEAYFYDALLAEAEGDRAREQADLQRVLRTKARNYTEFVLAEYLVSQEHPGP